MGTLSRTKTKFVTGYGRISEADDDEGVGNQRYFFEEWAEATDPGVPTAWYEDNDITGTTSERGGLTELREAIGRGEVSVLWVRDQSRLQRDEELWFAIKRELLAAGIVYFETRNKGRVPVDDLVTSIQACIDADRVRQDRRNLMDRQRRDAEKGRPPNGAIYGYRAKRNADGQLVRPRTLEVIDDQAETIRYVAREILSGRTTTSIARQFARDGVRGAQGALIASCASVEALATNPTVAGLRVYQTDLVVDDDGKPLQGNWPAILDADVWQDVRTVVATRRTERKASAPAGGFERRRYILSGLMRCGRCADLPRMHGVRKPKPANPEHRAYKCKVCGATISMGMTDRMVLDVVATRLADAVGLAEAMAIDDDADRRDEIHRGLDAIDARRAEVRADRDDGLIDRDEYRGSLRRLNERRDALAAELAKLVAPASTTNPAAALVAFGEARQAAADGDPNAIETLRALAHEWLTNVVVAPHVRGQAPETRLTVG